ncbi:P-loop containing nucleoside triphosphate hydrolase protein [Sordaria brevicollis]|uniref:P-loop containing nucleoside triphosphate hydrolase protein n=1 Tax=Sordaria brevicollis TaxID=83679 RepID=A0AAE0PE26_SORBR|nr:P-loop containing nucleoside triphosphate hydrolase protein [Sordaria brevicollis]
MENSLVTLPSSQPPDGTSYANLDSLGNHIYLEKQDKLRDLGIDIQTSQIIVVGGQSSGKSSLLESLTGFSLPRGQGCCTRFATQITLRRHPVKKTVISIIPRANADQKLRDTLRAFRHELTDFRPEDVASVIEKANVVMEIRSGNNKDILSLPMFSDDILKIEISSPDCFSVLAVLSCLSDPATEGILQLAKAADPKGERTVGVLTKADLVKEKAVLKSVSDLALRPTLKLGYFVVRNRGADEDDLDISECKRREAELFEDPAWKDLANAGRLGVDALRTELQTLLTGLAKRELPKQKAEVLKRLAECEKRSILYGPPRSTPTAQREHLIKLALRFERLANDALEGLYSRDVLFEKEPPLKLITRIIDLNEGFSNVIWKKGQTWNFEGETPEKDDTASYIELMNDAFDWASTVPELSEYCHPKITAFKSTKGDIMTFIGDCYSASRGPELGSFGGSVLTMAFKAQASYWDEAATRHVKTAILVIHRFLYTLLKTLIKDKRIREELWSCLQDDLLIGYQRACEHAKFVINTELNGRPVTYNHYFNDNLQKARLGRQKSILIGLETSGANTKVELQKVQTLLATAVENKSNAEQVREDIHDMLKSYYKVARKRFVDNICQQAINHFLLDGDQSPVKVFTADWVAKLSDSRLSRIAGEDASTLAARKRLETELEGLRKALEVLRS